MKNEEQITDKKKAVRIDCYVLIVACAIMFVKSMPLAGVKLQLRQMHKILHFDGCTVQTRVSF